MFLDVYGRIWKFQGISQTTSHLTIFIFGMRAKGKIQINNYQYGQRGQSFAGETSSVSLIAYLHA